MPQNADKTSNDTGSPPRRQRPGNACEKCRRRKLRCDRQQPHCGSCLEAGEECRSTTSRPRGPKRGHMKALQDRLAAVEELLASKQVEPASSEENNNVDGISSDSLQDWSYSDLDDALQMNLGTTSPHLMETFLDLSDGENVVAGLAPQPSVDEMMPLPDPPSLPPNFMSSMPATMPMPQLPDLMHSDRDQLYFDRVHPFVPIFNVHRYAAWSHDCFKTESQVCLQQTMWILATSASAQDPSVNEMLYNDARQRLEALEAKGDPNQLTDVTQAQAWLLLAFFEFTRVDFGRGWMSAGRAFRRIQLMRLHELDRSHPCSSDPTLDWVDLEERRRTFWLAYAFDRFISLSSGSYATFSEQVGVRLPAPHSNFQSGEPIATPFLSEIMQDSDTSMRDSFTQFIIMATVCGRALTHRQQTIAADFSPDSIQSFWERHQHLSSACTNQLMSLSLGHLPAMTQTDPILLFSHTMAVTMTIYIYRTMVEVVPTPDEKHQALANECTRAFCRAAVQITSLAGTLSQMSCFKVHPLCPIPLYLCAEYLTAFNEGGNAFDEHLKVIHNTLSSLKRINILGPTSQSGSEKSLCLTSSSASDGDLHGDESAKWQFLTCIVKP